MILRTIRHLTRPLHKPAPESIVPYSMFNMGDTEEDVRAARRMERIYHKGQERAWNGKELLAELIDKHGGIQIEAEKLEPLRNIFAVIFWGELAAWKVAADLALNLEPLEAKMAASSQAHDEARHFYVMHDYLQLLNYSPNKLPPAANRILHEILTANSMAKKILGMHLMVEPIALTLFQLVREHELEPVLSELLVYYERDEARHIALGVHYLPQLIEQMSHREVVDFYLWQMRMFMIELDGVREMQSDFRALGFSPAEVVRLGQLKQLHAGRLVAQQLGSTIPAEELLTRVIDFRLALSFPEDPDTPRLQRWRDAFKALALPPDETRILQEKLDKMKAGELFGPSVAA